MRRSKRRVLPIACVDCGEALELRRRETLRRDRTPLSHFRCTPCEDKFLTVLDPVRLAKAVRGIFRE
jgi:hypothetical protein